MSEPRARARLPTVAAFVSPHGFGHAARTCAVLQALRDRLGAVELHLFTTVPRWFFEASLRGEGTLETHPEERVDVGLVQRDALREDVPATVAALDAWDPFEPRRIERLARRLEELAVDLVLADISPLGLLVAERAGLPSVLIENFSWGYLYEAEGDPARADVVPVVPRAVAARLAAWGARLDAVSSVATRHLRAEPACPSGAHAGRATGQTAPLARRPRLDRETTRSALGVPLDARLVMVTLGGIPWSFGRLQARLAERARRGGRDTPWLLIAGGADRPTHLDRAVLLPHRSEHYHPDLVAASDAVLAKLGYSTLAEVATQTADLAFVGRPHFRETAPLARWAVEHLGAEPLADDLFDQDLDAGGGWIAAADAAAFHGEATSRPARAPLADGNDAAAAVLAKLL